MPSDGAELGKDDGIVDVLGRAEGTLLGAELMLGCKLGLPVGDKLRLGEPEGGPEGSRLGEWEGLREGNELGLEEGCPERLGLSLGIDEGELETLGASEGAILGSLVSDG